MVILSVFNFSKLIGGNPVPFALQYTFGNILSICGTMFLVGPKRQLRNMTSATRWIAALVYVSAMAVTLVACFVIKGNGGGIIVLACVIVQFCAMFWYALSYIPYGRRMFRACCVSAIDASHPPSSMRVVKAATCHSCRPDNCMRGQQFTLSIARC